MENEIVENLSFEEYKNHEALSMGSLMCIDRSPAHFKYYFENPKEETEAMLLGRATHSFLLEPERFNKEYFIAPHEVNLTTNKGKEAWADFEIAALGRQIIRYKHAQKLYGMAEKLEAIPEFKKLLDGSQVELSLFWKDHETQIMCKGRPDLWNPTTQILGDLKTTENASYNSFTRTIENLGYYKKAAWYMRGMEILGKKVEEYIFIAVESEPPHECSLYCLDKDSIRLGYLECEQMLKKYSCCKTTDLWPGYPRFQDIGISKWLKEKIEAMTNGTRETSIGGS